MVNTKRIKYFKRKMFFKKSKERKRMEKKKQEKVYCSHDDILDTVSTKPEIRNIEPVYIVSKNYINSLKEALKLSETEEKKWRAKYHDLLGSIKSVTNQFN